MKIRINLTSIILVVLVFFTIYYPPIVPFNTLHILAAISALYVLNKGRIDRILFSVLEEYTVPLFLMMLYIIFVALLNGEAITNGVALFVMAFETVPICYMIADLKIKNKIKMDFWDIIIAAGIIQALISVAALLIPSLQNAIINRFLACGFRSVLEKMSSWRVYGYSYTLAYAMPVVQAIIATAALYKSIHQNTKYYVAAVLIFLSAVINARVSIIIFGIGALGVILCSFKFSARKFARVLALILVSVFLINQGLKLLGDSDSKGAKWIADGITDIVDFFKQEDYSDSSYFNYMTDAQRYKLPEGLKALLGTGNSTTRGNVNYKSDIGYINDIWLGGIAYMLCIIFFFSSRLKRTMRLLAQKSNLPTLMFWTVIVMLLVANIKGQCFSWNEIMQFVLLVTVYFRCEELRAWEEKKTG